MREQPTLRPLDSVACEEYSCATLDYFEHFGLGCTQPDIEHRFGTFVSDGIALAGHLYCPRQYKATVLLVHGYLNHAGQFRHLIRCLLQNGYAAAVFDLPGHGLSEGSPAAVDAFERYARSLLDFSEVVQHHLNGPFHAVGFSLGGAVLIELLLSGRAENLHRVVLAAPLIRWALYEQSKGTYKVYSAFTDKIARFHRRNSSDRDFLIFNKTQDYLHRQYLSLTWVKALFDWNERLEEMSSCERKILVLQGDSDGTVDWKYNLKAIQTKFPDARIAVIGGANHELFNEAAALRKAVVQRVSDYFEPVDAVANENKKLSGI